MGLFDFLKGTQEEESAQARVDRLRREAEAKAARAAVSGPAQPAMPPTPVAPPPMGGAEQQIAQQMQQALPGAQVSVETVNLGGDQPTINALDPGQVADMAGESIEKVERVLRRDIDGDGQVGSAANARSQAEQQMRAHLAATGQASPAPPPPAADRASKLVRLERLHAAGALTDAEFEREKQRLAGA